MLSCREASCIRLAARRLRSHLFHQAVIASSSAEALPPAAHGVAGARCPLVPPWQAATRADARVLHCVAALSGAGRLGRDCRSAPRRPPRQSGAGCAVRRSDAMADHIKTSRPNLYAEVTERVIAQLEAGILPWVQPWDSAACGCTMPANAVTGRRYSGSC